MAETKKLPQIICFGASISEWSFDTDKGIGRELQQRYAGKAEVVNQGYAGYFTTDLHPIYTTLINNANTPLATPIPLITILVGANDSAIINPARGPQIPLPTFSANIRYFVDSVLAARYMPTTKIILIASPPLNLPTLAKAGAAAAEEVVEEVEKAKEGMGFKNYMAKKEYAERVMQIAGEYEGTGRVAGLDSWGMLVDRAVGERERERESVERLPGCGLVGAEEFPAGWYTDALHLGSEGYEIVTQGLFELMLGKWPELAPEVIGG